MTCHTHYPTHMGIHVMPMTQPTWAYVPRPWPNPHRLTCYTIFSFLYATPLFTLAVTFMPCLFSHCCTSFQDATPYQPCATFHSMSPPRLYFVIQDLIKFTPVSHHDRIVLQIALVNVEQTAEYLNEAKRNSEQKSILHHLQTHITKLPMKLLDSCSTLVKHSIIKLVVSLFDGWQSIPFTQCNGIERTENNLSMISSIPWLVFCSKKF